MHPGDARRPIDITTESTESTESRFGGLRRAKRKEAVSVVSVEGPKKGGGFPRVLRGPSPVSPRKWNSRVGRRLLRAHAELAWRSQASAKSSSAPTMKSKKPSSRTAGESSPA